MKNNNQKVSSIVDKHVSKVKTDQFMMPTWGLIVVLIICFIVLKKLIYIPDPKRDKKSSPYLSEITIDKILSPLAILSKISSPSITWPNTVYFPFK